MGDGKAGALGVAVLVALLLVFALIFSREQKCCHSRAQGREGFLIYPYIDLDTPGERGSPYALAECT
jgi:hypothetical protein